MWNCIERFRINTFFGGDRLERAVDRGPGVGLWGMEYVGTWVGTRVLSRTRIVTGDSDVRMAVRITPPLAPPILIVGIHEYCLYTLPIYTHTHLLGIYPRTYAQEAIFQTPNILFFFVLKFVSVAVYLLEKSCMYYIMILPSLAYNK